MKSLMKKNAELLKADPVFIKSDKNFSIISPIKPEKAEVVGSFRLIGTYTKDQILQNTVSCKPKVSPRYVKSVSNVDKVTKPQEPKKIKVSDTKFIYENGSDIYLPISIEGDTKSTFIVKENKGSVFLKTDKTISINNQKMLPGLSLIHI